MGAWARRTWRRGLGRSMRPAGGCGDCNGRRLRAIPDARGLLLLLYTELKIVVLVGCALRGLWAVSVARRHQYDIYIHGTNIYVYNVRRVELDVDVRPALQQEGLLVSVRFPPPRDL
eukprot:scaffold23642_cov57-Phaeocystis_antarctica.AAC.2